MRYYLSVCLSLNHAKNTELIWLKYYIKLTFIPKSNVWLLPFLLFHRFKMTAVCLPLFFLPKNLYFCYNGSKY